MVLALNRTRFQRGVPKMLCCDNGVHDQEGEIAFSKAEDETRYKLGDRVLRGNSQSAHDPEFTFFEDVRRPACAYPRNPKRPHSQQSV